ncbi:hypothetical protein AYO47_04370 [Planctomyces sp. SCGC AG-212-M04]|nr:hypothetical protein AYO47_04370 [Planctomyces sp. SCGC AG-212-M04]
MSPELETLDQLLGGDLPLSTIRLIFGDDRRFVRSISAMLNDGQVTLRTTVGKSIERWQWCRLLQNLTAAAAAAASHWLSLTEVGARRLS